MISQVVDKVLSHPINFFNEIYLENYYNKGLKSLGYDYDCLSFEKNILFISYNIQDLILGLGGTLLKYKNSKVKKILLLKEKTNYDLDVIEELGIEEIFYIGGEDYSQIGRIIGEKNIKKIFMPFILTDKKGIYILSSQIISFLDLENIKLELWMYEVENLNDLRLINRVISLDNNVLKAKENLCKDMKIRYGIYKLIDRSKGLLVESRSPGAEVFIKMDSKIASELKSILENEGYKPEDKNLITSPLNLIPYFLRERKYRRIYNNNINFILKNKVLKGEI